MKTCPYCRTENDDNAIRCITCGAQLQMVNNNNCNSCNNDNYNNNYNNYANNPNNNYTMRPHKNVALATLISLIGGIFAPFFGAGNIYLNLKKRYTVEAIVAILCTVLMRFFLKMESIASFVFAILIIGWYFYTAYDTYRCAKAINEGRPIPKLLGYTVE
ncbi:zinc ribbon domain-containing protein [Methanosphaera cuniculi]|uniref:zinc ribbon domain-containing protein n=1 Tax=Methanosphaera cuniculi TaxID=1077256 RepID=UPI0026DC25A4|nr:zinc ribbon domain-containing protein [Methanosphaera cuniculi]